MKVVALAGGVGGAKLASGLAAVLAPDDLAVIVNTGDDFEWHGLYICPDLDTVTYTLSGLANSGTGWGIHNDTFACLERLRSLAEDDWFRIGDKDLATHILRTWLLKNGMRLGEVTQELCRRNRLRVRLVPMTEDPMPTRIHTDSGTLEFQDYFVRRRCSPAVRGFTYLNSSKASPAPGLLDLIHAADAVIVCPSNPFISIGPILAVPGIREALTCCKAPVLAVSPIVAGKALKGPTAAMLRHMKMPATASAVAALYRDFADVYVLDESDREEARKVADLPMESRTAAIIMTDDASRARLAQVLLEML